jgi:O-antigen/teichoic acid export membrane protein
MAKKSKSKANEHKHPGGSAAILGVQLLRFSGVQGLSLGIASFIHYGSIVAVGAILGNSGLGGYSLLLFLTGLVTQIIHMLTKPGTIRRTFGVDDEDDEEDDEEDEDPEQAAKEVSERPLLTAGIGLGFTVALAFLFSAIAIVFNAPIAHLLLGDKGQGIMVIYATITAGMLAIFRLTEIMIWFEQRPKAFLVVDVGRPTLNLAGVIVLTLTGNGLTGAILGPLIGTTIVTFLSIWFLRKSVEIGWNAHEFVEIVKQAGRRAPVISSMWIVQNVDTFVLSRYVDHKQLGLYNLASRTGFVVAILPQGFRVALRPLRRGAAFQAMKKQYGTQVANGQLLSYFVLLCITAILGMVLLGLIFVHDATGHFQHAAGLLPLAAGAMTMPSLFRTVNGMAIYPDKRGTFVKLAAIAAVSYIGFTMLIVPRTGIYGPPEALLLAFLGPLVYIIIQSMRKGEPIDFPWPKMVLAAVIATAMGLFFHYVYPPGRWLQILEVLSLMGLWTVSLFALKIVPAHHRAPLLHVVRSAFRGSAVPFETEQGIAAVPPKKRDELRSAIERRLPLDDVSSDGEQLIRLLRKAGRAGDVPVGPVTDNDRELALFLFAAEPTSSKNARLRALAAANHDSHDIRTLEEVAKQLRKAPDAAWDNGRNGANGRASRSGGSRSGRARS